MNPCIHVDINEQIGSLIKYESLYTLKGALHTILINYKVKKKSNFTAEKTEQINRVSQE